MLYILIIIILGEHTHSVEFKSKIACNDAKIIMEQSIPREWRHFDPIFVCLPKGHTFP